MGKNTLPLGRRDHSTVNIIHKTVNITPFSQSSLQFAYQRNNSPKHPQSIHKISGVQGVQTGTGNRV
ncbi:hypothetical protein WN55_08177 [Dufourea novaeangliae]|uniref:Uncharacterized protein n=1 Tax=Dufourea novaeangliae TaxID=178035 RepID=A0A154P741_DUFNO|nr:hypothetical protein WN55_08177 [Dufourea novaeangliae]